ncbi:hypothetical protein EVAR_79682_1 [Eumeta japonica]|uniref:Uncharacterized protein n=1 Tax=Eumeta variegata TaxID=151549 RepID=A0A4C1TCG7_EUMVA|nr:hypothetical protein EVAR_79682_1 [Eumeta japonica]
MLILSCGYVSCYLEIGVRRRRLARTRAPVRGRGRERDRESRAPRALLTQYSEDARMAAVTAPLSTRAVLKETFMRVRPAPSAGGFKSYAEVLITKHP